MMKVGFDISQIAHPGGVATYTQNLAQRLINMPGLEMTYYYSSLRKLYQGNLPNVKSFNLPPTFFEILFNKLRFVGIERFIGQVDVFHSSDWVQPPTKAKKVTTYHDVVPLKYPQWSHPKIVEVHKRRLQIVEKEIDMVIAVSQATKKDLMEISSIPSEKITVIYEGVDDAFKPRDVKAIFEFKKKWKLPEHFVLAIGGVGTRRNLERVKEASKKYNLVITGETIPYVPTEEMPLLYASAQVLLYPSLYEGFGLPILEAMAVGTPVLTSNVSAMPEIGGESALYVDPTNVLDITQQLDRIMVDSEIRKQLITQGLLRAAKFSWGTCAEQTADVYRKVCGNHM